MEHTIANSFGKIWVFWDADWDGEVISDTIQQQRLKL